MKINILVLAFLLSCGFVTGQTWAPLGSGTNGFGVYALQYDAASGQLFVGGSFNLAGGLSARNIARYDVTAQTWSAVTSGTDNPVRTFYLDSLDLIVGGDFTQADGWPVSTCIARWDGSSWISMGTGFAKGGSHSAIPTVNAIEKFKGQIYVAGVFDTADGSPCNYISRWNGTGWEPVGTGMTGAPTAVNDMIVYKDELYVAGDFGGGGGVSSKGIVRYDGTNWKSVGGGVGARVFTMEVKDGYLFAGGNFTTAGGFAASRIARWDGSVWTTLGAGTGSDVTSLQTFADKLWVSGIFTTAGGTATDRMASWDSTTGWSAVVPGLSTYASILETDGNYLYAGGPFTMAGGASASHVARYTPFVSREEAISENGNYFLYPNPAAEAVYIGMKHETGVNGLPVEIYDASGKRLIIQEEKQYLQNEGIDVSSLSSGYYFVKIYDVNGVTTLGLVK